MLRQSRFHRARLRDAAAIQLILHAAYQIPKRLGISFFAAVLPLHHVIHDIKRHRVYLFYLQDQPIGSVTIRKRSFGYEIAHLAVLPQYQGRHFGKRLLRYAERKIRALGSNRAYLFTAENHPWLTRFYQKNGYIRMNTHRSKNQELIIGKYVKKI